MTRDERPKQPREPIKVMGDLVRAGGRHHGLHVEAVELIKRLLELVERAKPIVEQDAIMMANLTRFAPLPPDAQAKHDSTESASEKWLMDLSKALSAGPAG